MNTRGSISVPKEMYYWLQKREQPDQTYYLVNEETGEVIGWIRYEWTCDFYCFGHKTYISLEQAKVGFLKEYAIEHWQVRE